MEVITIGDSDDEDKENVSMPTRHVRRRTLDTGPVLIDGIDGEGDDDVIYIG
jgi:hypothetical protein